MNLHLIFWTPFLVYDIYNLSFFKKLNCSFVKFIQWSFIISLTIDKLIEEYDKIRRINQYCNNELLKYNKTFNLVTPEINLSNGWTQPRNPGKLIYAQAEYPFGIPPEKYYNSNLVPISVFDFNFIKAWIKIRQNISRFGRRWSLTISQHSQTTRDVKHYRYMDGHVRGFGP